jgi:hypothetical protein
MAIWYILLPFHMFYGHLEYFVVILVYFSIFGLLYQEKSGNPALRQDSKLSVTKPDQSQNKCISKGASKLYTQPKTIISYYIILYTQPKTIISYYIILYTQPKTGAIEDERWRGAFIGKPTFMRQIH